LLTGKLTFRIETPGAAKCPKETFGLFNITLKYSPQISLF